MTATDERHEAAGIPLTSALVLRNLARNIPKSDADDLSMKRNGVSLVDQIFKPVEPRFYEVMAHNRALVCTNFLHRQIEANNRYLEHAHHRLASSHQGCMTSFF